MAISEGGDEFDVTCIEEAVNWQKVGQVIDVSRAFYSRNAAYIPIKVDLAWWKNIHA